MMIMVIRWYAKAAMLPPLQGQHSGEAVLHFSHGGESSEFNDNRLCHLHCVDITFVIITKLVWTHMSMIMPVLYLLAAVDISPKSWNNFQNSSFHIKLNFYNICVHSNVWRCLKTEEERQGRHMCTITCGGFGWFWTGGWQFRFRVFSDIFSELTFFYSGLC